MPSLQEALAKTGLISPEVQRRELALLAQPLELRALVRRFEELKHLWPKLEASQRFGIGLLLYTGITIEGKKEALEMAVKAMEEIVE